MTNKEMIEYFEKCLKNAEQSYIDGENEPEMIKGGRRMFFTGMLRVYEHVIEILKENEK